MGVALSRGRVWDEVGSVALAGARGSEVRPIVDASRDSVPSDRFCASRLRSRAQAEARPTWVWRYRGEAGWGHSPSSRSLGQLVGGGHKGSVCRAKGNELVASTKRGCELVGEGRRVLARPLENAGPVCPTHHLSSPPIRAKNRGHRSSLSSGGNRPPSRERTHARSGSKILT